MNKELVQVIYDSLVEGRNEDYQSFVSPRMLLTNNSKYALKWDLVNTNIKERLHSENVEATIATAGSWQFLLILDKKEQRLYTLMNSKRYDAIIRNPSKNAPKYMKPLLLLNTELNLANLTLFDLNNDYQDLRFHLNKLCSHFSTKNNFSDIQYNIIDFTTDGDEIVNLSLKVLDKDFGQVTDENLLNITKISFSNQIEQVNTTSIPKPILKLKKKAELKKGEKEAVSIKESISEIQNLA